MTKKHPHAENEANLLSSDKPKPEQPKKKKPNTNTNKNKYSKSKSNDHTSSVKESKDTVTDSSMESKRNEDIDDIQDEDEVIAVKNVNHKDSTLVKSSSSSFKMESKIPFMDTFYQLSVEDPNQRNQAASHLLHHIFFSSIPSSSFTTQPQEQQHLYKDGLYALTRLIKGLASSRLHARIGFSTCLTTFLQFSFQRRMDRQRKEMDTVTSKRWIEYFIEQSSSSKSSSSASLLLNKDINDTDDQMQQQFIQPLLFIRNLLLENTSVVHPTTKDEQGRKKNNHSTSSYEEKDLLMGRLLGISAIVRSGILMLMFQDSDLVIEKESSSLSSCIQVLLTFVTDLLELFTLKPWLQESSLIILMDFFSQFDAQPDHIDSKRKNTTSLLFLLLSRLMNESLFIDICNENKNSWTVEKLALILYFQTIIVDSEKVSKGACIKSLPSIFRAPLLTVESLAGKINHNRRMESHTMDTIDIPYLLSSSISHKLDYHIIWDVILSLLTVPMTSNGERKSQQDRRMLRSENSLGGDTPEAILGALINHIVVPLFMESKGISDADPDMKPNMDSIYDAQTFTLRLVQKVCCSLVVSSRTLEFIILQPIIVRRIFIDTVQRVGKKNLKMDQLHTQGSKSITDIVETVVENDKLLFSSTEYIDRRLAIARALVRANPSFDSITHTSSVSQLLELNFQNSDVPNNQKEVKKDTIGMTVDDEGIEQRQKLWNGYHSFLLEALISSLDSSHHDNCLTATKIIDAIFQLGKRMLRITNSSESHILVQNILDIFLMVAFFDLKVENPLPNPKTKEKKKKSSKNIPSSISLSQHLDRSLKALSRVPNIPKIIRNVSSSRFFSLILDTLTTSSFRNPNSKTLSVSKGLKYTSSSNIMQHCVQTALTLEQYGLTRLAQNETKDPNAVTVENSTKIIGDIISMISSQKISSSQNEGNLVRGFSVLILSLYLQLLVPKVVNTSGDEKSDFYESDDDEEDEYDDLYNDVVDYINQLYHTLTALLNPSYQRDNTNQGHDDGEEDNEDSYDKNENLLSSLASHCIDILSLFGSETNSARGAACKLMKECVKTAWGSSVSYVQYLTSEDPSSSMLNEEVLDVILRAVCIYHEDTNLDEVEDAPSETSIDIDDDRDVFAKEIPTNYFENAENSVQGDDMDDGSETVLDDSGLQKMLLEDSDDEVGDNDGHFLEHHAGADKALAQLIRIKQQAKKAGRLEQEKVDLSHKLRCFGLLEAVFSVHSPKSSIPAMVTVSSLVPLLKTRRQLNQTTQLTSTFLNEKSKKSSSSLSSYKKSLIAKIDSLIQEKIVMSKGTLDQENSVEILEVLFQEMSKSQDSIHSSIVSACIIMIVKCTKDVKALSPLFAKVVSQWSTKPSCKLSAPIFQDLISRCSKARVIMTEPLIKATENARTFFLKAESYALLSTLYHDAVSQAVTDHDELNALQTGCYNLVQTTEACLQDDALIKSKRIRNVLKAVEKITKFAIFQNDVKLLDAIKQLSTAMNRLEQSTESVGVKDVCRNVMNLINNSHGQEEDFKNGKKKRKP